VPGTSFCCFIRFLALLSRSAGLMYLAIDEAGLARTPGSATFAAHLYFAARCAIHMYLGLKHSHHTYRRTLYWHQGIYRLCSTLSVDCNSPQKDDTNYAERPELLV